MQTTTTTPVPSQPAPPAPIGNVTRQEAVPGGSAIGGGVATTQQPAGGGNTVPVQQQSQGLGGMGMFLPLMIVMMIVFMGMNLWMSRKDKKKREDLLSNIGRFDKVQTVGGIVGTVVEQADNEVVLRVDEQTNTRIRFNKSAISSVLKKNITEGKNETINA